MHISQDTSFSYTQSIRSKSQCLTAAIFFFDCARWNDMIVGKRVGERRRTKHLASLRLNSILWYCSIAFNVPFKLELFLYLSLFPFLFFEDPTRWERERQRVAIFPAPIISSANQTLDNVRIDFVSCVDEIPVHSDVTKKHLKVSFHLLGSP